MIPCPRLDAEHRPCRRPLGHDEDCGAIRSRRVRVQNELSHYLGQTRPNGLPVLDNLALDDLGDARTRHVPTSMIVIGEQHREDGHLFLDYGVTREYVERTPDLRYDEKRSKFRVKCPECGTWDGKHSKDCRA